MNTKSDHYHRRRLVRVDRCAAPWPQTISDLHSVDSSRASASSRTLLSQALHATARAARRSSPAGHLAFCLRGYLLCAVDRFARSTDCAALSVNRSPAHQSVDRAAIDRRSEFLPNSFSPPKPMFCSWVPLRSLGRRPVSILCGDIGLFQIHPSLHRINFDI